MIMHIYKLNLKFFIREKPRDTEWLALREMKLPILLNYAQCKLLQEDYYEVIQHCNEVLEAQPSEFSRVLLKYYIM